jgi:hypothetical protein
MEVKVYQANSVWASTGDLTANLNTLYYSIAFRGSFSDNVSYNDAIVYGTDATLLRVYKTADYTFELQAKSNANYSDLVVECNITSKKLSKVTPTTTYTNGTTTGGTAYTASPNNNNITKFAGDIIFEGAVIDDATIEDLRVNERLFFGANATGTYGPLLAHSDSGGTGKGIRMTVDSDFQIWGVTGNQGEQDQAFYAAGGVVKLYSLSGVVLETVTGGVRLPDNMELKIGTGNDLKLYHDGTNSYITNVTGVLNISGATNFTGILTVNEGGVWNATTPGLNKGSIHIDPDSATDHAGGAITFGASDSGDGNNAQAGIYIRSDGTYGTNMYLATTDSYVSGSITAMSINYDGNVAITRGTLTVFGTVTSPSLITTNTSGYMLRDSSTAGYGLFKSSTTSIGLASNGSVALNIDSSGNSTFSGNVQVKGAAIGTTQADGDYLAKLYTSSADGFMSLYTGEATPLERIRISSYGDSWFVPALGGNIGIGTTIPDRQLEIYGPNDGYMKFDGGRTGNHGYTIGSDASGFIIYDDTLSSYRLVIDQDTGHVGIGNPSPSYLLHLSASVTPTIALTDTTNNRTLLLRHANNDAIIESSTNSSLIFNTNGANERMKITSAGVVEIGSSTAQSIAKLNVRVNGAAIEFGHTNNSAQYYGTLGTYGSNGFPYIGLSTYCETSVNTFTTNGIPGVILVNDVGNLDFRQVTTASASGQTPVTKMRLNTSGNLIIGGTTVDQAGSVSLKSTGIIRSVLASGTADSTLINGISGVSNGFQLINDASNNQEYIFHNGNTQSLKIDSSGNSIFAGNINILGTDDSYLINGYQVANYSYFGYSTGYPGIVIGNTGGQSLFFNVDPVGNPSGSFTGDGREYVYRNVGSFITPNASNNGYNTILGWNSSGNATFAGTINSGAITSTGLQVDGGIINYQQGDTYADGLQFLRTGATRANIWLNSANNTLNITRNLGTVGMAIDSSGNVGIGTITPTEKLEVNGEVKIGSYLKIGSSASYMGVIGFNRNISTGTIYNSSYGAYQLHNFIGTLALQVYSSVGGFVGQHTFSNNGDVNFFGKVGIGNTNPQHKIHFGEISGYYTSIGSGNSTPGGAMPWLGLFNNTSIASATYGWGVYDSSADGSLQIWNRNSSTTGAVALTIKRGGDVGIGTNSPATELQIGDYTDAAETITIATSSDGTGRINFYDNNNTEGGSIRVVGKSGGSTMYFANRWDTDSDKVVFDLLNGNVGIGTTLPDAKLHVSGSTGITIENTGTTNVQLKLRSNGVDTWRIGQNLVVSGATALEFYDDVNNVDRMVITNSGNVGIGTPTPNQQLELMGNNAYTSKTRFSYGVGATNYFADWGYNSGGNKVYLTITDGGVAKDVIVANYTGNVGIGTSSPQSKLSVNTNTTSPGSMLEINNRGDLAAGSWSAIRFGLDSNTYPGQYGKGGIIYESRDGYNRGKFHLAIDNTADTSSVALADAILTVDGTTGKVGIGNTTPVGKLDIQYDMDVNTGSITGLTSGLSQYGNINFSGVAAQSSGSTGTTMQGITWQVNNYNGTTNYGNQAQLVVGNNGNIGTFMGFFTSNNYGAAPSERIRIDSNGLVGINDTSPSYQLDVNGTIRATSDVIAFSDRRVKENIVTIDNALEKVTKLRGVTYTRKDLDDKSTKVGVIAQEVLEVLPEVVSQDDEGKYSVAYGNMAGVFIEAIKELENRIKELENKSCNCKCK